jgi:Fe-S-cluster containining protein
MYVRLPVVTPRFPDGRPDFLTQCTKLCGARCCRYVSLPIPAAKTKEEFDDWRWYVSHEGVSIFKDGNSWYFCVETRCRHLQADNACAIYETRPMVCRDYDPTDCEFVVPDGAFDVEFKGPEDLEAWLRKKKEHRNRLARLRRRRRRKAA